MKHLIFIFIAFFFFAACGKKEKNNEQNVPEKIDNSFDKYPGHFQELLKRIPVLQDSGFLVSGADSIVWYSEPKQFKMMKKLNKMLLEKYKIKNSDWVLSGLDDAGIIHLVQNKATDSEKSKFRLIQMHFRDTFEAMKIFNYMDNYDFRTMVYAKSPSDFWLDHNLVYIIMSRDERNAPLLDDIRIAVSGKKE